MIKVKTVTTFGRGWGRGQWLKGGTKGTSWGQVCFHSIQCWLHEQHCDNSAVHFAWALTYECHTHTHTHTLYFFIVREGKGGRKRGRETSMCGCLSRTPYWGPAHNPGMCPDWESNQRSFGSQAGTQSTEPHHQGYACHIWNNFLS